MGRVGTVRRGKQSMRVCLGKAEKGKENRTREIVKNREHSRNTREISRKTREDSRKLAKAHEKLAKTVKIS